MRMLCCNAKVLELLDVPYKLRKAILGVSSAESDS